jgi:ribosome-interacting GTPase 1
MGHLCRLKAQLAKYKRELLLPQAGGGSGKGEGFDVPKSGDIRIGLIGLKATIQLFISFYLSNLLQFCVL